MSKKSSKNLGMSSSFKASNIQTYAAGGSMGGWPPDKFLRGANLYSNAFYTNTNTGSLLPQANFGLSKSWGPKYAKNTLSADVGMPYGNNQIGDFGQNTSELGQQNFTETGAFGDPNLGAFDAKNPFSAGLHYGYEGINDNTGGGRGSGNLDIDYNTKTGLGVSGVGGLKFDFGRPANTYNEIRTGTANATLYPHIGFGAGHNTNAGMFAGLGAEANWKPRFLKRTPLSLYGKAQLQAGFGGGATDDATSGTQSWSNSASTQTHDIAKNNLSFRPSYSLQAGIKAPLRDIQSTVRGIDIRDLNLPSIERNASEESTEEGMPIPDGIGVDWEKGNQLNASPIHKRWQPNTGDIYIPPVTPFYGEPMTYDPATGQFENNTEEMNNYSKGGGIHIDPKNKGKFTASAEAAGMGTQEFASHVLANRGSYTPLQVQRANFAHNAASWQHAQGGFNNKGFQSLPPAVQAKIKANSFADGGQLTQFNEGGTHEESPLGGIPQGMAPDGKLNLVEEGETKLNAADYIFSDQIKIDKETATLYSLPKGDIGKTFAEVSKKLNRPNSRRENDTIEQVAIQRDLENLMQAQEKQKEMQKDVDIAEFSAKYPELAQNLQAPQQAPQQSASMPQGQQQMPMSPEEQMMQEQMMQQQMAPPAEMPQQMVDPAMAAQMGQLPMSYGGALFNCGGKMYTGGGYMYNDGGHMYDAGGVLRNIGAGAYGIGEGLLDTLTFGLTDNLTDKGYNKLASMGHRAQSEIERDNMIRGFGNTAGAVGGAILTGGAATSSAVSEGAEGLAAGATNIKGTGEKFDKIANSIGQGVSMAAGFMGPQGATQAEGVFKGNEAVNKLMTAKQNPFINQATNFATNAINFADGGRMNYSMYQPLDHITQYGGPLNMPTANHPYLNYLAAGGGLEGETPTNPETTGVPKLAFNLNGIVVNYTLEEALKDPLVLEAYGADTDKDGNIKPETVEIAKLALEERFNEEKMPNRIAVGLAEQEYNAALNEDANLDVTNPNAENTIDQSLSMERLPGETDEEYAGRMHAMNMKLEQGANLAEIKQTPMQGAIMALPAMYNLGRGIFEKPKTLDYEKYKRKGNLEPYTMNIDPQVAEVRKAYAGAAQAVKNAAPGSGAYLGNMANIAAGKQKDMNELLTKKEMFDKNSKFEVDKMNKEIEAQNLALEMQLQAYNDQARAAKMQSIQAGLTQLADIASNEQGVDLQESYLKAVAPQYAKNFKYSSIFDQLQQTLKARKANKGKGK